MCTAPETCHVRTLNFLCPECFLLNDKFLCKRSGVITLERGTASFLRDIMSTLLRWFTGFSLFWRGKSAALALQKHTQLYSLVFGVKINEDWLDLTGLSILSIPGWPSLMASCSQGKKVLSICSRIWYFFLPATHKGCSRRDVCLTVCPSPGLFVCAEPEQ